MTRRSGKQHGSAAPDAGAAPDAPGDSIIDVVLTKHAVAVSDFKKNPNAVVAQMNRLGTGAMAVMTNNTATFYVVTPELLDELLEIKWERDTEPELRDAISQAQGNPGGRIPVSWEDLLGGTRVGLHASSSIGLGRP